MEEMIVDPTTEDRMMEGGGDKEETLSRGARLT